MKTQTPSTAPAALPVPALASFVALVERPLIGGTDKVLKVAPAESRNALLIEALGMNDLGLSCGYTVEDAAPLVIRQAGTQYHARWEGDLALYASESAAAVARERMEAERGIDLVIEALTPEVATRYSAWRVMG